MKRDNKPPFTLPLLLNCRLENESQGLCSLFFWSSFNTFGFKDPHWVCGAINNSLSTTGFCKQLVSSMDWTSSGNLHNSQQGIPATDGSWARQAEMWVELETQPDLKCNFPYVCEDILTKIRRNLLWVSALWTPVLYRVQVLKWSLSHGEGIYNTALRCEVFPKKGQKQAVTLPSTFPLLFSLEKFPSLLFLDTYPFYKHCKNLLPFNCFPLLHLVGQSVKKWQHEKDRRTDW